MFPTPAELGLPAKFKLWRPNQPKAISDALECPKRAKIQMQRAGEGKSASYVCVAQMRPNTRMMVLTINRSLQDQLMDDFESIGMVHVKGHDNYMCEGRIGQTCQEGSLSKCPFKGTGVCPSSAARMAASERRLVNTNYSCWLAANKYGRGFGKFDILVLDEAHDAPAELARAMQISLGYKDLEILKYDWPDHRYRGDMTKWKDWALVAFALANTRLEAAEATIAVAKGTPKRADVERLKHVKELHRKMADLSQAKASNWVCEEGKYGYKFDPIDAGAFAERMLFQKIPSLLLTSGTIHPRLPESLGLGEEDYEIFTYETKRSIARTPLYYLPVMKVVNGSAEWQIKRDLVGMIDRIIESRIDRKGVIHTGNFKIARWIREASRYRKFMFDNIREEGHYRMNTAERLEQFRQAKAPAWFVSPSIGTGTDLPYDQCRVSIIAKLPFADASSAVERARAEIDPLKGIADMWMRLGQQFGRGDRADDDWQETFVLDQVFGWVEWKHADLAPTGLLAHCRPITSIPPAPEIDWSV